MSDTQTSQKAVKPDAKETVEMLPPPAYAIRLGELIAKLSESVTLGFERVNSDIAVVKNRQEVQAAQMKDLGSKIGRLGERVDKLEGRTDATSQRVGQESNHNLQQDSAISTIVTDVADLKETQARQLAILERLDKVTANPMVRRVAYAIGALIIGWAVSKGYLTK